LEAVCEIMHDQQLVAMVKLAEVFFFCNGGELVSNPCGWSSICASCDDVIWIVMELSFFATKSS